MNPLMRPFALLVCLCLSLTAQAAAPKAGKKDGKNAEPVIKVVIPPAAPVAALGERTAIWHEWTDKEGHDRYTTEIIASEMKMLGSRAGMGDSGSRDRGMEERQPVAASAGAKGGAKKPAGGGGFDDLDDDIPF